MKLLDKFTFGNLGTVLLHVGLASITALFLQDGSIFFKYFIILGIVVGVGKLLEMGNK